jgi:NAD(P)-dependent dehydrogenase (short-subunit alcohol dehydrogenase family)
MAKEVAVPVTLPQRTALVTGSSRGLGRGIVLKLAEAGVRKIAVNYNENENAAIETAQLLKERGADSIVIKADVGNVDDIKRMFATVKSRFGSLDIYVSNARATLATGFYQPPMAIPLENWQATFDSQARELLVATREAVAMMGQNGRIIVITYAPGGRTGSWQPWVAMGSAKAAKEALARYFAVALAQRGITVNCVSPGACDDSVLSGLPPEVFKMIKDWHESGWTPMRRLGTPADVGNAVVLLCSEQANFITGQLLHVDGGGSSMTPDFPLAIQGIA